MLCDLFIYYSFYPPFLCSTHSRLFRSSRSFADDDECARVLFLPGHQVHPSLLNLIQVPSPSPSRRLTLPPIQPQSRRVRVQTPMVLGHAQGNETRGGGGHESAASHANHLVIETPVAAQGVDISYICIRWRYYLHMRVSCIVCALHCILQLLSAQHPWNCSSKRRRNQRSPCKSIRKWRYMSKTHCI